MFFSILGSLWVLKFWLTRQYVIWSYRLLLPRTRKGQKKKVRVKFTQVKEIKLFYTSLRMCAFSYCMSRINIFMLARWHEKRLFLRKQGLFQGKSFLILYLTSILYCPQFQQLIAVFCILKLDWNILLFSRSNLFFASDFILSLQPFLFLKARTPALSTQSCFPSHMAQEPSWRFTAHSSLPPGWSSAVSYWRTFPRTQRVNNSNWF